MKHRVAFMAAVLLLLLCLVATANATNIRAVRERISIDAKEDVYLYDGADFYMYSDKHETEVFAVDGSTGHITTEGDEIYIDDDLEVTGRLTVTTLVSQSVTLNPADITASDDITATDDLVVGGDLSVTGASYLLGSVSDSGGDFTVADNVLIDGQADAAQLIVQGHSSQTAKLITAETSAGTDKFTVDVDGNVVSAGTLGLSVVNSAGGSVNPFDWTGTLGIMDGSDDATIIDINPTNADHTGSTNTIQALDVGNITGDAQATETAIKVGTGWDSAFTAGSLVNLDAGLAMDTNKFTVADTSGNVATAGTLAQTLVNSAGASANPYDYTGTLGIMDGSDDFTLFDANITNADHTGSTNTVQVLDVANITGDAHATETAIKIGTGWDAGLSVASPVAFTAAMNYLVDVSSITTDTVLTAADSGTTVAFKNQSTFEVIATLPAAAAGLNFCFYNYDGDDVSVDAGADDQIHVLTNAAGDEIDNTTAGNFVCLVALDGTDWVQTAVSGTWSDD